MKVKKSTTQTGERPVPHKSLRKRLLTALVCLAIVPLLIVWGWLFWHTYLEQAEQVKELQMALTEQVSEKVSLYLDEQEQKMLAMTRSVYLPAISRAQQAETLLTFLSTSKEEMYGHVFNEIALLDNTGKELVRQSRIHMFQEDDLTDRSNTEEYLVPIRTGKNYYGPVYFDETTGAPLMKISMPVKELRTLAIEGILVAELNLMSMRQLVTDTRIGKSGTAYLLDQQRRVIVHPNPSIVLQDNRFDAPPEPEIMAGIQGERAVVAAKAITLNDRTLWVVTELPTAEAFQHLPHTMIIIGAIIVFTLAGAVALGAFIVHQLIRPIESLARTARAISRGDFSQKAGAERMDEFGDLATAFNTMTGQLLETIRNLDREKNFVRNSIEAITYPFYIIDVKDYTVQLANSAAGFGAFPEGKKCYQLTHNADTPCGGPDHPCTIEAIKKTKRPVLMEHLHGLGKGDTTTYEVYGFPIFDDHGDVVQVIEYCIDITEKKYLEAQLRQSQKLEAIGSLAGGVAHDFNNILTAILGYSEIIMMAMAKDDPLWLHIEAIHTAGDRAAGLTRQLLAFSRKQVMELKVINLDAIINNMTTMLGRLIGERIEMKLLLRNPTANIKADPGQIEQIIMNLTLNARDAMPDGGSLILETDTIELDEEYSRSHAEVSPGSYVVFSITDTGHGMTPDVRDKIFDPFFTTKRPGKGTGLGLSTVYGIIKQLEGHIFVYSEPGRGTTFKIYFHEEKETVPEKITPVEQAQALSKGKETVLVVDDDPTIRKMVSDTLAPFGYQVVEADSGEKALEIYNASISTIDLLLTDVIMPGMNGRELFEKVQAIRPNMKVLFMSGYTDNVIAHQGVLEPGILFINKPLVPSLLTKKIREILDS
jgi:signal transduction histidine kinase/HAMP domain-containing protein